MANKGKVLGIDYGSKNVGFAVGDFDTRVAIPKGVLDNRGIDSLVDELIELAGEFEIILFVVGWPLPMEAWHGENRIMNDVRLFAQLLAEKSGLEVRLLDELLSSFEADRLMEDVDSRNVGKMKLGRDAYAAQVILQRFFDSLPAEDQL